MENLLADTCDDFFFIISSEWAVVVAVPFGILYYYNNLDPWKQKIRMIIKSILSE
jgi:hypothetical protein